MARRKGEEAAEERTETEWRLLQQALVDDPSLRSAGLAHLLQQRLGLSVHPRSIERALERHTKKLVLQ